MTAIKCSYEVVVLDSEFAVIFATGCTVSTFFAFTVVDLLSFCLISDGRDLVSPSSSLVIITVVEN